VIIGEDLYDPFFGAVSYKKHFPEI
jgi:hypothetical protein